MAALSAPYDLSIVGPFFERKGVDGDLIGGWIFENRRDEFDPLRLVLRNNDTEQTTTMLAQRLPPFCILHGTKDGPVRTVSLCVIGRFNGLFLLLFSHSLSLVDWVQQQQQHDRSRTQWRVPCTRPCVNDGV